MSQWQSMWDSVQEELAAGYHAVALLRYETGCQLQAITSRTTPKEKPSQVLIFEHCQMLSRHQVTDFLQQHFRTDEQVSPAGIHSLEASINQTEFTQAIAQIQAYIAAGDTYQVNYTYRLHFQTYGSPIALYLALRARQPVPYGALIHLSNDKVVLSFSPELFVRHQQGALTARPMKGTAAASGDLAEDERRAHALSQDQKNRAENLMIVDLLRNDLGRIAETGSVKVPRLFEVNRFTSVLQMTSTIEATVKSELNLAEVMSALFPCGSITGAPKKRTMEIIREIETEERGLYTGAIGWFAPNPNSERLSDFCLSVPIRTLELEASAKSGERKGRMGVGAGIVFDSVADEEYAECQLKAKFLTGLEPRFALFETMRATREEVCQNWALHLERLHGSAQYFGFRFNPERIAKELQDFCSGLDPNTTYRLKLTLQHDGTTNIQSAELTPLNTQDGYVNFLFENEVCHTPKLFLAHKTTIRQQYDTAWQRAERHAAFDAIFINEDGYVTEGGRSTVLVCLEGQWFTPPLSDGVLPGVMRRQVLTDRVRNVQERSITVAEFLSAEQVVLANSLRGLMPARRISVS
ncbi:aminodeoxychorismate synthase component I [Undibacterium sp. LX40W]|uniref:Aminodeoxychorismate synthase component I n=2 Tax=Oxalobacteraceae TaxID=75682 RepID=A0A923KTP1_9BURK|nr:aminodeoxychorismate synthase component I [Undibacterium nitidum]MBC3892184.1 aminodeoxychorismate synthase component I [Undibacterium sp. LX40W]